MKPTKLVSLAIPVLLLASCGVGDKDSTTKTEEVSSNSKVQVDEEQYPVYIMRGYDLFTTNTMKYSDAMKRVNNKEATLSSVKFALQDMNSSLERLEDIEPPSKYKSHQEKIQEGVDEAKKGVEMIQDAYRLLEKGDVTSIDKAQEGLEVVQHGYEMMEPTFEELDKENPDAFNRAAKINKW